MNNYPIWWDTTITIYNKFMDPQTKVITWYRTVVTGAFWKYVGNKVTIGQTVLETNDIICRIRKDDRFLEKHLWLNKPNDEIGNYFTLGKGDIIVRDEVEDIIQEGVSGHRSSDLLTKYKNAQGCMTIDQIAVNTGPGRCEEHYFVKGI